MSIAKVLTELFSDYAAGRSSARARRRCSAATLRDTPHGFRLAGNRVMNSADFEPAETAFISAQLTRAGVFVDVGANIGFYSCLARKAGARVIAIEASRDSVECLLFNLGANGWDDVEVVPAGLANRIGIAPLHGGGTGASLLADWAGASTAPARSIPLTTLDTVVGHRFEDQALLIKVDVEGAELGVVQGATAVLQRQPKPVWLLEICLTEHHPAGLNPDFEQTFEVFWRHGYEATALLDDGTRRLVTPAHVGRWAAHREREFGYVSYVFEAAGSEPSPL